MNAARIHPTAEVHSTARVGDGAVIWSYVQIRENARVGARSVVGRGVYIDADVSVGSDCKIQNYVCTYIGVTLEDGVFVGPHACFTNDLRPRAIRPDGTLKGLSDWIVAKTLVQYGASIGANATIVCGADIGRWALVAAGSVVTRSVPDYGMVRGSPARLAGFVSPEGYPMEAAGAPLTSEESIRIRCTKTGNCYSVAARDYALWRQKS